MDDREKSALRLNRLQLTKGLKLCASFYDGCYESKIFTQEHINLIKREPTDESQISHMLDLLLKRGPDAFTKFVKLLRVDHSWLADKLENTHTMLCKQAQGQEQGEIETTTKTTFTVPPGSQTTTNTKILCKVTVEVPGHDNIEVEVKSTQKVNEEISPVQLLVNETKPAELDENECSEEDGNNSLEVAESMKGDSKLRDESVDLQQENEDKKQTQEMRNKLIKASDIDSTNSSNMTLCDLVDKTAEKLVSYKAADLKCRKILTETDKQKPLEECVQKLQEKKFEAMKNEEEALTKLLTTERQLKEEHDTMNTMKEEIMASKIQQQQLENEKEELKRQNEDLEKELEEGKHKFDKFVQQQLRSGFPTLSATFPGQPRETREHGRFSSFNSSKTEKKPTLSHQSAWKSRSKVADKAYFMKNK